MKPPTYFESKNMSALQMKVSAGNEPRQKIDRLAREHMAQRHRFERQQGRRAALVEEKASQVQQVSLAKYRLGLKPQVQAYLDALQNRAQARSIGVFEKLLTGIKDDIMPDADGRVEFDLGVERGRPALDILMDRQGEKEDIYEGRGGSLTNVVSMGLRFITLSRTRNRRFIILDEPDCWLQPDRIPAMSVVIEQLSREIGVQCLLISHHDPAFFAGKSAMVELSRKEGRVCASVLEEGADAGFLASLATQDLSAAGLMEGIGIRYLRLRNFRSHEDTLIPLSANVTALIGGNDIGKSAVVQAFRALAYNKFNASMIRHQQPELVIEVGLEDEAVLSCTYRRTGADRTIYRLVTGDGQMREERNGRTVPDFVKEYLAVTMVEDMDIHVGSQKEPVFMLGSSCTKTQRAGLISLGREASYVQKMVALYGDALKEDARTVKRGEQRITEIDATLERMRAINDLEAGLSGLDSALLALREAEEDERSLAEQIAALEGLQGRLDKVNSQAQALATLPEVPEMADTQSPLEAGLALARLGKRLEAIHQANLALPEIPELSEVAVLASLMATLEVGQVKLAAPLNELPVLPEVGSLDAMEMVIQSLAASMQKSAALEVEHKRLTGELGACETAIQAVVDSTGGMCPLCQSAVSAEHFH